MKKINVLVDTVPHKVKPISEETGRITERLKAARPVQLTAQEILQALVQGRTIVPSGTMTPDGFTSQQIWLVDVDGTVPLSENLKHKPAFVYSTFSDTDGSKYRLAFVSNTLVTDINQAIAIQQYLNNLCGGDTVCKNINRLYYGGKTILYEDYKATFNPATLQLEIIKSTAKPRQPRTNTPKTFDYDKHRQCLQAIEQLDVEASKRLVGPVEGIVVDTLTEQYHAAHRVDLSRLLGLPIGVKIKSLTRDNDTNPSAHIYVTDDGVQVYKDFGTDGITATAVKLVEILAGVDTQTAAEFITTVFGITINPETDWQREIRNKYKYNKMILEDESFSINYPYTAKRIRYDKYVIVKFAELAADLARTESRTYKGLPVFILSKSKLAEYIGRTPRCTNTKIQHLNNLGFIIKLHPHQCDPYTATQLESLRHGRNKYTNAYAVPILSDANLSVIEARAKTLTENCYTKRGASREYMQRTFDKAANNFYPQYRAINNQYSDRATKWHMLINFTAQDLYQTQGYWTEQQVINRLTEEYGVGAETIKTQLKRSLPQILRDNQWQRTRDKATRDRLGLKPTRGAQPFIITRHGGN